MRLDDRADVSWDLSTHPMQHIKTQRSGSTGRMALMLGGLILALTPTGVMAAVTSTDWELDVLRLLMVVSVSLLGIWPWATAQDRPVVRRLYIWVGSGAISALYYLVSGDSVFLFVSFCVLVGASLDIWMRRAHMASDELRKRLQHLDRGHQE